MGVVECSVDGGWEYGGGSGIWYIASFACLKIERIYYNTKYVENKAFFLYFRHLHFIKSIF